MSKVCRHFTLSCFVLSTALSLTAVEPAVAGSATLVINEVDSDQVGTDISEFVEIYDGGVGNTSLTGYVLVFFNGSNNLRYAAFDLDGLTTDADGYFVAGNAAVAPDLTFADNLLQNGQDAVALYQANGSDFPANAPVTTTNLIDAVVYDTADADDPELLVLLNPGEPQIDEDANGTVTLDSVQRCPNGSGGARNTSTYTASPPTPRFANCAARLSVGDRRVLEGDSGSRMIQVYARLSAPAPMGGISFDAETLDGTATDADNDYEPFSSGFVIPEGDTELAINVEVNGDTTNEAGPQAFSVEISNSPGAFLADSLATVTLVNDDPAAALTLISEVQGDGTLSTMVGNLVTLRGLVTGNKNNGFFLQEEDADWDLDPDTSEGIFIFTNAPATDDSLPGNLVQVTGTVTEFFLPGAGQSLTEIDDNGLIVASVTDDVGLPTPVDLTTSFPDPAGGLENLETVELMLVRVPSFTVVAPTRGSVSETTLVGTSDGQFYGVVTGTRRPFREAGLEVSTLTDPNLPPCQAGVGCAIPVFDLNPERLRVDSDGQPGAEQLEVTAGQILTNLIGPLDYAFRTWSILPLPGMPPTLGTPPAAGAADVPIGDEFTVASFNIQRFFDTVNDPESEPLPTPAAYAGRLERISRAIRNFLHTPDIIAIQEVEKLAVLEDIADQIDADALANSQPVPQYAGYLVEGNDLGGIDVGYLVRTDHPMVTGDRVTVHEVVQELDASVLQNPDTTTTTLNDRPPLRLSATVNFASGPAFPLQVINVHQRSLGGVNNDAPGSGDDGWDTEGDRVRAKRQAQADDLAQLIQTRQSNNPNERMVVLGDFNAFMANDGYGDIMGTLLGSPAPATQVVTASNFAAPGIEPDLIALDNLEPVDQRYSFTFDGHAQSLDHVLINTALDAAAGTIRLDHARLNADFPQTARNDPSGVARVSDHDPIVVYLTRDLGPPADLLVDGFESGDLSAWDVVSPP